MAKGTEDGIKGTRPFPHNYWRDHIEAASGNGVLSKSSSSDA